jgi:hypothetical protein
VSATGVPVAGWGKMSYRELTVEREPYHEVEDAAMAELLV